MMLNAPQATADFLAGAGYGREAIAKALLDEYGEFDPSVIDTALRKKAEWDAGLDAEVRKEQDAAIAAEHDEGGQ